MGRESEAGYSLNPDRTGTTHDGTFSQHQGNQEMQLVIPSSPSIHSPPSFYNHPPLSTPTPTSSAPAPTWKRFAIPTKTDSLSSGFPFHPRLYDLKVTHDQWHLFTTSVVSAAKMTGMEDYLAWTTGITTGTLVSPFLLVLAPVVGYYSGKAVHKKTLVKTVNKKLGEEGDLRAVLKRWNEGTWKEMGFQAWLELPVESGEVNLEGGADTLDLGSEATLKSEKEKRKVEKKAKKRFRIVIVPEGDGEFRKVNGVIDGSWGVASVADVSDAGSSTSAGDRAHRDTMPPAYWDANDVGRHHAGSVAGTETGSATSPSERQRREEPLPSEIRYTRIEGYTNC